MIIVGQVHAFEKTCQKIYLNKTTNLKTLQQSENLVSYLNVLLQHQQIDTKHLQIFLKGLENGHLLNPISVAESIKFSKLKIAREGIQFILDQGYLDLNFIKDWLKKVIDENMRDDKRKHQANKQTILPFRAAQFHSIKPGYFKMGIGLKDTEPVDTWITKPFEMMSTLFTQAMWVRLQIAMKNSDLKNINPSVFKDGDDSVVLSFDGQSVRLKPDHPLENVSWDDFKVFLNKLNDLSKSDDSKIQDLLISLFPGHQKDDIYDLPSEAQWEFVYNNRGAITEPRFLTDSSEEILKYAWMRENSDMQTHEVAQLLPRLIDRGDGELVAFYDLEGNVSEWIRDWQDWFGGAWYKLRGGVDPEGPTEGKFYVRVIKGSNWHEGVGMLQGRFSYNPLVNYDTIGFRLVRTRASNNSENVYEK